MKLEQWMSRPVVTVGIDDDLELAARRMWDGDCGVVAVVDHEGRLAGMLTDRDICMAAWTQGRTLKEIGVSSAMAREVVRLRRDDRILDAERLMATNQVRRVPIVDDDDRPVGLISLADLARVSANRRVGDTAALRFTETFAAVSARRAQLPLEQPTAPPPLPATPVEAVAHV